MSITISGSGIGANFGGNINTNSKKYKAAMERFGKNAAIADRTLTEEQRLIQEVFGLKEQRVRTWMSWFDEDGNYTGSAGIAGMVATGIPESERHQIISVSENARQNMFDETLRHFKLENGVANGNTTKRSEVYREYQLSVPVKDRLKGTWTLGQYEKAYREVMYDICKSADASWELGKPLPSGALKNITRETVESCLVQSGNTLVRRSIDITT